MPLSTYIPRSGSIRRTGSSIRRSGSRLALVRAQSLKRSLSRRSGSSSSSTKKLMPSSAIVMEEEVTVASSSKEAAAIPSTEGGKSAQCERGDSPASSVTQRETHLFCSENPRRVYARVPRVEEEIVASVENDLDDVLSAIAEGIAEGRDDKDKDKDKDTAAASSSVREGRDDDAAAQTAFSREEREEDAIDEGPRDGSWERQEASDDGDGIGNGNDIHNDDDVGIALSESSSAAHSILLIENDDAIVPSQLRDDHDENENDEVRSLLDMVPARETQPIGGPKYYVAVDTRAGRARVVHEAMPTGKASNDDDAAHGGPIAAEEERGYEVLEYRLARKAEGEEGEEGAPGDGEGAPPSCSGMCTGLFCA